MKLFNKGSLLKLLFFLLRRLLKEKSCKHEEEKDNYNLFKKDY
jgi:hypothetical protein